MKWILTLILVVYNLQIAKCHGRLLEPPSRSSMWRLGYETPVNYHNNELFCGGFTHQWDTQNGRCGPCGDAWDTHPRQNEAGGKYATGLITRYYKPNSAILAVVELTAPHAGWFEFRICVNNDVTRPVTHACLAQHLLSLQENGDARYYVTDARSGLHAVELVLPPNITCSQCVFQWKYHSGNSWGINSANGKRYAAIPYHNTEFLRCVGCGPQEEFYGCSDVAIGQPIPTRQAQNVMTLKDVVEHYKTIQAELLNDKPGRKLTKSPSRTSNSGEERAIAQYICLIACVWLVFEKL